MKTTENDVTGRKWIGLRGVDRPLLNERKRVGCAKSGGNDSIYVKWVGQDLINSEDGSPIGELRCPRYERRGESKRGTSCQKTMPNLAKSPRHVEEDQMFFRGCQVKPTRS